MQNREVAIREAFLEQVSRGLARQLDGLGACRCRGLDGLRAFSRELSIICGDESALVPRRERMDVGRWIHGIARRWQKRFGNRAAIRVSREGDTTGAFDPALLESIVAELLSNALEYGAPRPVEVRVQGFPKSLRITIGDEGPGLERDPRRGRRFARGRGKGTLRGFGIGVWLTRRLVHAHDGRFRLVSPVSGGTRAIVELPRSARAPSKQKSRRQ